VQLPNEIAQEDQLGDLAHRILVELLSRPDPWHATAETMWRQAREARGDKAPGIRKYEAAFKELRDAGYLTRQTVRGEDNRWRTEYTSVNVPPVRPDSTPGVVSGATCGNTVKSQVGPDSTPSVVSGWSSGDTVKPQVIPDSTPGVPSRDTQKETHREETQNFPPTPQTWGATPAASAQSGGGAEWNEPWPPVAVHGEVKTGSDRINVTDSRCKACGGSYPGRDGLCLICQRRSGSKAIKCSDCRRRAAGDDGLCQVCRECPSTVF
jgi:hypothetical protein